MAKVKLKLDLNRVEGDLEIELELENQVVTDAKCIGTMFRGFEQILKGRAYKDGVIITPRICGICGTAHSYAAVTALETALQCSIAPNGTRVRNCCLMTEEIQSDSRHAFLMFMVDFCHESYSKHPLYSKILEAFEPFKGKHYRGCINPTKDLLKIVAMLGGQWPHSSYMLPGGVLAAPNTRNIISAMSILDAYIRWYETSVLGCSLDRWTSITTLAELEKWVEEKAEHSESAVGLFFRFGRDIGLQHLGKGAGKLLSYGVYFDPEKWQPPFAKRECLRRGGFFDLASGAIETFDHSHITEHVKHSWYQDYEGGRHPWEGETIPNYQTQGDKYTWAKAPRYKGEAVEVGPLAELFMDGDPLIQDLLKKEGSNVWTRQFARFHRPVISMLQLKGILREMLKEIAAPHYLAPKELVSGEGCGLIHAARGPLGHWIKIKDGLIDHYQIITPTSWNASPRDSHNLPGHWEQTLIGTAVKDLENPIEIGHVVRSHDACLVCTVHFVETGKRMSFGI